ANGLDVRGKQGGILGLSFPPESSRLRSIAPIPELGSLHFSGSKSRSGTLSNATSFLLGRCSIEVQHERFSIGANLWNDEGARWSSARPQRPRRGKDGSAWRPGYLPERPAASGQQGGGAGRRGSALFTISNSRTRQ